MNLLRMVSFAFALAAMSGSALTYYTLRKHGQNARDTFNFVNHQIGGGGGGWYTTPRYNVPQPAFNQPQPFGQPFSPPSGHAPGPRRY